MRRIYISRGAAAISQIHNNKKQERKTPSHNIGHLYNLSLNFLSTTARVSISIARCRGENRSYDTQQIV
jgi:hypothetical protein